MYHHTRVWTICLRWISIWESRWPLMTSQQAQGELFLSSAWTFWTRKIILAAKGLSKMRAFSCIFQKMCAFSLFSVKMCTFLSKLRFQPNWFSWLPNIGLLYIYERQTNLDYYIVYILLSMCTQLIHFKTIWPDFYIVYPIDSFQVHLT